LHFREVLDWKGGVVICITSFVVAAFLHASAINGRNLFMGHAGATSVRRAFQPVLELLRSKNGHRLLQHSVTGSALFS